MSEGKEIGAILIRLLADEVAPSEVRLVLQRLHESAHLRECCSAISTMVNVSDARRGLCCDHMIGLFLDKMEPRLARHTLLQSSTYKRMANITFWNHFMKELAKDNPWYYHTHREGKVVQKDGKNNIYLTQELHDVVLALENMWGVPKRYTIPCRKKTLHERQTDELVVRGSKVMKSLRRKP